MAHQYSSRSAVQVGSGNVQTAITPIQDIQCWREYWTNHDIAVALFLSRRTVEANLARAYRKLGISSRAELGAVMAERKATARVGARF